LKRQKRTENDMDVLSCISIDDEEHCNKFLTECCLKIPFVKLLGTFTDPFASRPLLQSGKIDLVFLDFNMRTVNAPEFVKEIPPSVQIIIVSGELESKIREYGMKLSGILSKPYRFERFLQICKAAAKSKK
jgi:two-component SAPR family response regulator